jgi:hypothetical protein
VGRRNLARIASLVALAATPATALAATPFQVTISAQPGSTVAVPAIDRQVTQATAQLSGTVTAHRLTLAVTRPAGTISLVVDAPITSGQLSAPVVTLTLAGVNGSCVDHAAGVDVADFAATLQGALRSLHMTFSVNCLIGGASASLLGSVVQDGPAVVTVEPVATPANENARLAAADGFGYGYTLESGLGAAEHCGCRAVWVPSLRYHTNANTLWGAAANGRAVLQRYRGGSSTLVLLDLKRGGGAQPSPPGLNSRLWEWSASITRGFVFFNRGSVNDRKRQVVLYNMRRHTSRVLIQTQNTGTYLKASAIAGRYAVWYTCVQGGRVCRVRRTDIVTNTTITIPSGGANLIDYDPAVLPNGTVYFVRSALGACGASVRIMRFDGHTTTMTLGLPKGVGANELAATPLGGYDLVYYTRTVCSTSHQTVWRVTVPPQVGP